MEIRHKIDSRRQGRLRFMVGVTLMLLCWMCNVGAATVVWNDQTRRIEFVSASGKAWLVDGIGQIAITDGPVIATSDKRFQVTVNQLQGRQVLTGIDGQKVLDWEMVIHLIDADSVRIDWTIYNRSDKTLKLDRLDVLIGKLTGEVDSSNNRILTSGHNSWEGEDVGRLEKGKAASSYYTLACQSPSFAGGFLAGRHNLDRFTLLYDEKGVQLTAYGECDGCVLGAGASRSVDPLFVSGDDNPLAQMEHFADLAAKENGVQLWPENFATWCSWYAGWMRQEPLYDYKEGLERGVEANIGPVVKYFGTRGAASMRVVDDSNEMAYGDWDNKTLAIANGFDRLAGMMNKWQVRAGIWYPPFWVSTKSRLFREHKDYLYKEDDGKVHTGEMYGNGMAYLDASNPAAAKYMESTARAWRDRGYRYVMTDFMNWGARKQPRFNATLTPVEAHNQGLQAMRRGYGKDTYWLHCGALLGPAMGLCDGMRISGDSHGEAIYSYVSAGTRWFYNWRVWINDPDAIVCVQRGKAKSVDWNRTWMSWMALAGNVLTYGDSLDDLPKEYIDIYQRILPPLPVAGRPLDLWENEPYLLWGMSPGEADGDYTLFGVFEFQGNRKGQKITLNLDEVVSRSRGWKHQAGEAPSHWLLWDFWQMELTTITGHAMTIDVPEKSCHVYSLRPYLGRPQLIGTTGHFSQGVLEVKGVKWDAREQHITGKVKGNGGDPTQMVFHVPKSMQCVDVYVNYVKQNPNMAQPGVLMVDVGAVGGEAVPFELRFAGKVEQPKSRKPVSEPVGRVE